MGQINVSSLGNGFSERSIAASASPFSTLSVRSGGLIVIFCFVMVLLSTQTYVCGFGSICHWLRTIAYFRGIFPRTRPTYRFSGIWMVNSGTVFVHPSGFCRIYFYWLGVQETEFGIF